MIKRMIHRRYAMMGNKISLSLSLSPLGDRRKIVSKLKSPAVIDRIFSIELAGVENGDLYRKQKQYITAWQCDDPHQNQLKVVFGFGF